MRNEFALDLQPIMDQFGAGMGHTRWWPSGAQVPVFVAERIGALALALAGDVDEIATFKAITMRIDPMALVPNSPEH